MENISTSLRRLHMSGMAMCWKTMTETHQADKLTFRDGLEILIQSEMDTSPQQDSKTYKERRLQARSFIRGT